MPDNPQLLVDQIEVNTGNIELERILSPDAIFLPFKGRSANVSEILKELNWYNGQIYLMPTTDADIQSIRIQGYHNICVLKVEDPNFLVFLDSLRTSHHRFTEHNGHWDLPIKRNYALYYSRMKGYRRILLLDDDIRNLTSETIHNGVKLLDRYAISGCFVQDFPDTSVFGHLLRVLGKKIYPFLSGSFLLVKPFDVPGFFPIIYNEDWLFMLPNILQRSICSFGTITQLPHDPFDDPQRAAFQEFGDIIADGLFWLIQTKNFNLRQDPKVWQEIIQERTATLNALKQRLSAIRYQEIIDKALHVSELITKEDCLKFIVDWGIDNETWRNFMQEITA